MNKEKTWKIICEKAWKEYKAEWTHKNISKFEVAYSVGALENAFRDGFISGMKKGRSSK